VQCTPFTPQEVAAGAVNPAIKSSSIGGNWIKPAAIIAAIGVAGFFLLRSRG
jgi:hypothetical protein